MESFAHRGAHGLRREVDPGSVCDAGLLGGLLRQVVGALRRDPGARNRAARHEGRDEDGGAGLKQFHDHCLICTSRM